VTIRFMTWNIKTGGRDRHGDRLGAIEAVIARERPDLLCLQELRGFERHGAHRMQALAGALGMNAHLSRSLLGQPVAVLVRPPLRITGTRSVIWRLHHAAAAATVPTSAGPLTVVSAHLNPFSPERRRREAVWLAARFRSRRGLAIVAGDLNGLAPDEDHSAALAPLPRQFLRRHADADGTVDVRALAAFGTAGFADLWRVAGRGDGTTVPTTRGGGREFPATRLDYVLASPALRDRARDLQVIRGEEAEFASDHYPVRAELDL
jgi:exodeoxyribonuclease III